MSKCSGVLDESGSLLSEAEVSTLLLFFVSIFDFSILFLWILGFFCLLGLAANGQESKKTAGKLLKSTVTP